MENFLNLKHTTKSKQIALICNVIRDCISSFGKDLPQNLFYTTTVDQYKYYIGNLARIYLLLKRYKITEVCELGSGIGALGYCLNTVKENSIQLVAYEIEKELINRELKPNMGFTYQKDIMELTLDEINSAFPKSSSSNSRRAFYFYEPFVELKLQKAFVKRVYKLMRKGDYLIADVASNVTYNALHRLHDLNFVTLLCHNGATYVLKKK